MVADLQENLQLTPSRNSHIPLPKWSPKLGGKREEAGRPRLHVVKQAKRGVYVKPGPWTELDCGLDWTGLDWTTCDIETRNPVRVLDFFLFTVFFHVE